jgi:hypothetical protein
LASGGNDREAPPDIESEWLAQALEARTSALRLLRYDFESGSTLPRASDLEGSERTGEGWRLLSDYLLHSEKLFALAAPKGKPPFSASIVDNSPPTPRVARVPSEPSKE